MDFPFELQIPISLQSEGDLLGGLDFAADDTVAGHDTWSLGGWMVRQLGALGDGLASYFDPATVMMVILFILVLGSIKMVLARMRERKNNWVPSALLLEMEASIRRQKTIIAALILMFFGGFLGWASIFELASAAIAPGVVSPEGSKRPVQHLEGGIISEVLVRDGDRVRRGQPLVVLEDVRARSEVDTLYNQRTILDIRMRRLLAERDDAESFNVRLAGNSSEEIRKAVAYEKELFLSRRESLGSQKDILETRIAQLEEEISGLRQQISSVDVQRSLIGEEIKDVKFLLEKGLHRRPRLLALQRTEAELNGTRAAATARIARSRQSIAETETQIGSMEFQFIESIDKEIGEVRAEMVQVTNELKSRRDVLTRTTINSPDDGTVVGMVFTSRKAVIRPGDVILEIVPENAELLVDAHVSPLDIDDIHQGQTAQVNLSAYKQRHMPRIEGVVQHVSADRFEDERTGAPYFLARIAINAEELETLAPNVEIVAGMPAEVMIRTGEQTLLDYIISPLLQSLRRSFRET